MSKFECNICHYLTGEAGLDENDELKLHLEIEHGITSRRK